MSAENLNIQQVCETTGLEESEVRFFENVFSQHLQFTRMEDDANGFTPDHVAILLRIKELVHDKGLSIDEVNRELRRVIKGDGEDSPAKPLTRYARPSRLARVIAITSGKGGVGKTTVSVNMAVALARAGKRVALLDADLGLANCHILLGAKPRFNLRHLVEDGFKIEDLVMRTPDGVQLISGGQGVRELANLTERQRTALLRELDRLERSVDVLLVDTGAGISENVLRFALFADEVVVVTSPNVSAAADAFSIIKILLEMQDSSKIGILANGVRDCYQARNVYNRLNAATQKFMKYTLGDLGYIVEDEHVRTANQRRVPLMRLFPNSDAARSFQTVVQTVLHDEVFVNRRKESSFHDLVGALKRSMAGVA